MQVLTEARLRRLGSADDFFLFLLAAKAVAMGLGDYTVSEEDFSRGRKLWAKHGNIGFLESGQPSSYDAWRVAGCRGLDVWQRWFCLGLSQALVAFVRARMEQVSPCPNGFPPDFDFELRWRHAEPVASAPAARARACLDFILRECQALCVGVVRDPNPAARAAWDRAARPGFGAFEVWSIQRELEGEEPSFARWKQDGRPGFREWRLLLSPGFHEVAAADLAASYRLSLHHISLSSPESTPDCEG